MSRAAATPWVSQRKPSTRDHAFFEQMQLKCLLGNNLLQGRRLAAQVLHFVGRCSPRRVAGKRRLADDTARPLGAAVGQALDGTIVPMTTAIGLAVILCLVSHRVLVPKS